MLRRDSPFKDALGRLPLTARKATYQVKRHQVLAALLLVEHYCTHDCTYVCVYFSAPSTSSFPASALADDIMPFPLAVVLTPSLLPFHYD